MKNNKECDSVDKQCEIIKFCANMRPIIIDYKTVWVPAVCDCGEFRIYEKDEKWRCARCGKEAG